MTSPARVFAVLDLFTLARPTWSADEINQALGYTRPTGYRYVKELVDAGFLQKASGSRYALGARIIMLDYQLRQTDPVLQALTPLLEGLVQRSGFDAVVTAALHEQIVDTYRVSATQSLPLRYGRGRARPFYQGAAAKVLLAFQPRARRERWLRNQIAQLAAEGTALSLTELRQQIDSIRRAGGYLSIGELDPGVGAYAVPLFDADGELRSALALVGRNDALLACGVEPLRGWLDAVAQAFTRELALREHDTSGQTGVTGVT